MTEINSCEAGWVTLCRACELNGRVYHHGAELARGATISECSDGIWTKRINPFVTAGP